MRSILLFFEPVTERSRYGKIFRQRDGSIEEDMVDSRWKTWSIGFDVHLKTVFAAVLIPDYSIGKIQRFVVKYDMEYRSLQQLKTWLLDFKKSMGIRSL